MNAISLFFDWLKDVYQRYGYIAVLLCLVVVVGLCMAVVLVLDISPNDLVRFLWGGSR